MGLGQHLDRARQVGLFGDRGGELDPAQPEHRQLNCAVGQLEHVLDPDHRADVV